jgi:hypothetical protein
MGNACNILERIGYVGNLVAEEKINIITDLWELGCEGTDWQRRGFSDKIL